MIRFFFFVGLMVVAGVASAQTTPSATISSAASSSGTTSLSAAAESQARDAEYAQWKIRYASNRTWIANEIKEIRSEIATLKQRKPESPDTFSDLLNGSVNNWNRDRTDYGDSEQFAACKEILVNLKTSVRNELEKK